jgi:hypothetical protein
MLGPLKFELSRARRENSMATMLVDFASGCPRTTAQPVTVSALVPELSELEHWHW